MSSRIRSTAQESIDRIDIELVGHDMSSIDVESGNGEHDQD